MNFDFALSAIFPENIMIVGKDISTRKMDGFLNASSSAHDYYKKGNAVQLDPSSRMCLGEVLDRMGIESASSQGLLQAVTTTNKLRSSDNHVIYVMTKCRTEPSGEGDGGDVCIGFLKMGRRRLFVMDADDVQHEVLPVCVMDFYVHEALQRHGYGKQMFDAMLQNEGARPEHLAIDRPSLKLTSFLAKHYQLTTPCQQTNNFVVYPGFFANRQADSMFAVGGRGTSPSAGRDRTDAAATQPADVVQHKPATVHDAGNGDDNGNAAANGNGTNGTAAGGVTSNRSMRNLHDHHKLW